MCSPHGEVQPTRLAWWPSCDLNTGAQTSVPIHTRMSYVLFIIVFVGDPGRGHRCLNSILNAFTSRSQFKILRTCCRIEPVHTSVRCRDSVPISQVAKQRLRAEDGPGPSASGTRVPSVAPCRPFRDWRPDRHACGLRRMLSWVESRLHFDPVPLKR